MNYESRFGVDSQTSQLPLSEKLSVTQHMFNMNYRGRFRVPAQASQLALSEKLSADQEYI